MEIIIIDGFGQYEEQAWEITKSADNEFIPPLSARNSTIQKNFQINYASFNEPVAYFNIMKSQKNIIALQRKKAVAIMSFIPDYSISIPGAVLRGNYVSTVITEKFVRGQGLAEALYKKIIELKSPSVITRTWSTNTAHIHILKKLGFNNCYTIPNDRGNGIDTVYYERKLP